MAGNLGAVRYTGMKSSATLQSLLFSNVLNLQYDNARLHVANVCSSFFAERNKTPLDRPPYSPGLSPIEHLCDALHRRVGGTEISPILTALAQLRNELLEELIKVPVRINAFMTSI